MPRSGAGAAPRAAHSAGWARCRPRCRRPWLPAPAGSGRGGRRDRRAAADVQSTALNRVPGRWQRGVRTLHERCAAGGPGSGCRARREPGSVGEAAAGPAGVPRRRGRPARAALRLPAPAELPAPPAAREPMARTSRGGDPPAQADRHARPQRTAHATHTRTAPRNNPPTHQNNPPGRQPQHAHSKRGAEPAARAPGTGALLAPRLHGLRVAWRGSNPCGLGHTAAAAAAAPARRPEAPRCGP
jgi:hypothetical protein